MPNEKTGEKRDIMVILEIVLNDNKTKREYCHLLQMKKEEKHEMEGKKKQ